MRLSIVDVADAIIESDEKSELKEEGLKRIRNELKGESREIELLQVVRDGRDYQTRKAAISMLEINDPNIQLFLSGIALGDKDINTRIFAISKLTPSNDSSKRIILYIGNNEYENVLARIATIKKFSREDLGDLENIIETTTDKTLENEAINQYQKLTSRWYCKKSKVRKFFEFVFRK